MKRLLVACLLSALLIPASPLPGAAEAAAPDHVVHAGAKDPRDPLSAHMFETYYPRQLRVHRGDRVRWEFPNQGNAAQAFHTVTFGDPDQLPYARADEVEGTLAFDERTFFTSGCGRRNQPVCVVSSPGQLVSSGTPIQHAPGGVIEPFDVVIDLPQGTYDYFCTLHHPAMQGTVEVVDDDTPAHNPKPGDYTAQVAADAEDADRSFAALSQSTVVNENGRRVWTVHAGAGMDGDVRVSTEAFLPASLNIRPGDTVRWKMGGTAHTVTFPDTSRGQGLPQHLTLNCEFDAPGAGAPGVPAIAAVGVTGLLWCPPGATTEMALTPLAAQEQRAPGDAVLSPGTLHNSGIMIHGDLPDRMRGRPAGSGQHFPSEFEATFPVPGTYTYRCLIHWNFMAGSITVAGA